MNIFSFLKLYVVTLVVFLAIDFTWLGLIAKKMYDAWMSGFDRTIRWIPAMGVYLLLVLGIVLLIVPQSKGNPLSAFIFGGVFGLVSYGVYDLTNLATLTAWSPTMAIVDLAWGAVLCGTVSAVSTYLFSKL